MERVWWVIIVGLCISAEVTFAGVGEWKTYTAKREVRDVILDHDVIWAATSGGLFSYSHINGTFNQFTTSDGLRAIDLTAVTVDNNGSVWTGASNGFLHRYDPASGEWTYISDISLRPDPQKRINALKAVGDTLFILSDIGVSVFSISRMEFGDTYSRFGTFPDQAVGNATAVCMFNDELWIGTRSGIVSTPLTNRNPSAPESWHLYNSITGGLPSDQTTGIVIANNSLFASTTAGLAEFNGVSWSTVGGTAGINIIDAIAVPSIYFITGSELWTYSDTLASIVATGFPSALTALASSSDIGTAADGVLIQSSSQWVTKTPPGPTSNKFVGIAVDTRGVLWGATGAANGTGFMSFDGQVWKLYNTQQDQRLLGNNYYKVSICKNNTKWISSWGTGVALLDDAGNLVKVLGKSDGIPPSLENDTNFVLIGGVTTSHEGVIWITNRTAPDSTAEMLFYGSNVSLGKVKFPSDMRHPDNVFTDVVVDGNDTKWFANFSRFEPDLPIGYFYYNEHFTLPGTTNGWGMLSTDDGLTSNKVWSEAVDKDGALWIGTDQGITIIFDPSNPRSSMAVYHPLPDQIIQAIVVDPLNNKWIATKQGVFVYSADGTSIINHYTVESTNGKLVDDDVASLSINPNNGTVYFGTEKGLSSLTTASVSPVSEFGELAISPNPFYLPSRAQLTVDGLAANSALKILSINGNLIREIQTPGGRVGFWDGTDTQGRVVATGVYLIVAYSEDGSKVATGKVAVIRR